MDKEEKQLAQSRYEDLCSERAPYLEMARECTKLTLPHLLTDCGLSDGAPLPIPWQSIGAKGVNVLAAKLMLALFPINISFFKLQINDAEIAKFPEIDKEQRAAIDTSLAMMEKMVMQRVAETSDRVVLHSALKHLVATGNVLCFLGKKAIHTYPLDRYVARRDVDSNPIEVLTEELVHRSELPAEFQQAPMRANFISGENGDNELEFSNEEKVKLYTWARLKDGAWIWHQEADGKVLPNSQGRAPKGANPWLPLRFNVVDGEDYGRGRVEEFIGDLTSLEGLMKALVEGSAGAAKLVFLVSPSATLKPKTLATASNGAVLQGREGDVSTVQVGKTADFQTMLATINILTQRLSDAFLILQVRDSERTTAAEVQAVQQELNEQLGGIFGSLTTDLLIPYIHHKLYMLGKLPGIPKLPKELVFPSVVAGLNGIGRGQDRQALMEFIATLGQSLGPPAVAQFVNVTELVRRLAVSAGIDTLDLIKTEETIKEEQAAAAQQMQQQQLTAQAGQLAKSPIVEKMINGSNEEASEG
jgi:hypothetical protein